jgi:ribosomal protein L11 methyltransferase
VHWLEVSVRCDGEAAEAVAEALRPFAYDEGVVLEQWGDADDPDPEALEPAITVKIFIPGDEDSPAIRRRIGEILYHLGRLYPIPAPAFRELQDEDWANAWKVHYNPFRVGKRLWIRPTWVEAEPPSPDAVILTLDPGMAFGTGLHPTTQMCLQALEERIRPGMAVLDVGCGSGILAICAALLGATQVVGVDTDRLAIQAATDNSAQNGVADRVAIHQGSLADVGPGQWDVVVVNILAPVIIALLHQGGLLERVKPGGWLILSGIIDEQAAEVVAALELASGELRQRLVVRDWVTLVASPKTKMP